MDNHHSSISNNADAHAEVAGRSADMPLGFRNQVIVGMVAVAAIAGAGWFFLSGSSERDIIDDRLAGLDVESSFLSDAPDAGYVYAIERTCGDDLTVTIDVGEAELDAPRPVVIEADGQEALVLDASTVRALVSCE